MNAMKGMLLVLTLLFSMAVAQAAIVVESVEVNDITLQQGATTRLDILKGNVLDVQVLFHEDQSDRDEIELEAFISGFEHNDFERARDSVGPFDIDQNVSYVKNLQLRLSNEFEEDDYLLRILFTDRNGNPVIFQYQLKIDVERHSLSIQDVVLSPGSRVEAGRALLATVRLENNGEKDEKDVRVMVGIPSLGISASDYIEEIEADVNGEEEETEELYLAIPRCAEPGNYDLEVVVNYDEGFEELREVLSVRVDESDSCSLTNSNRNNDREDDDDREDEEDTPMVRPSQDSGVQVIVENTVATPAQPEPVEGETDNNVRSVLEVILIILLVILVIVGIVVGVSKLRDNNEDEEEEF
ncbi:hypothetical protein J4410_01265 [Candidatus Woesearchaeota archaeon]|nr:hypothetical protein [Candidatus Woesearchaeota archaeon]